MRVGRAAIDEQAMRMLEQHNPDVQFDWARLLKEAPQEVGRRERDRDPRDRDRRDRREPRPESRPRPLDTTAAAVPPVVHEPEYEATAEIAEERADAHADLVLEQVEENDRAADEAAAEAAAEVPLVDAPAESVAVTHGEPLAADHAEYVEYAEASAAVTPHEDSPAALRLGVDGLRRLRARYAQLVARLADKPMDEDARVELNARVERLNPDAWRTPDEVAEALEQYEAVFESVRAEVGRPPRRTL